MSDNLSDAIKVAESRATILDDPTVVENSAVYHWLGAHEIHTGSYHHLVLGDQMLSPAWRKETLKFSNRDAADHFIRQFRHHHQVVSALRQWLTSSMAMLPGESDDAFLNRLSGALAGGQVWAITSARMPRNDFVGKTDPKVFAALNPKFGTKIDFKAIAKLEGGQWRRGYVPMSKAGIVIGASGMTIASGFDIGQWSAKQLPALGIPPKIVAKLAPFCGQSFRNLTKLQVAKKVAQLGPVPEIEKPEADLIDGIIFSAILRAAIADWDRLRSPRVPAFNNLPGGWQTVWLSRNYQEGPRPKSKSAQTFRKAALEGHWEDAIKALKGYTEYTQRATTEANTLAEQTPGK